MEDRRRMVKKKTIIPVIVYTVVVLAVIATVGICVAKKKSDTRKSLQNVSRPEAYVSEEYMLMNNNVNSDMMKSGYWIDGRKSTGADIGKEIMNSAQIEAFNNANRRLIVSSSMGAEMALNEINTTFNGNTAKSLITEVYGEDDEFSDRLNLDNVPFGIDTRFGFSVENTCLRKYPAAEADYEDGNLYYDNSIQSNLDAFMPVAIIHESVDGEWLFVLTYGYAGWVGKDSVAFCHTREEWLEMMNPSRFLIVTARELRIGDDPYYEGACGTVLKMGTRLMLLKTDEYLADHPIKPDDGVISSSRRIPYGNYIVRVPVRGTDGYAEYNDIFIPANSDVSLGYLPYTEENVADLALKCLGDLYGWAGDYLADDCSGLTRKIYACFGFNLPRGSGSQTEVKNAELKNVSSAKLETKVELLKDAPIGTLLFFPGHIMIYLGTVDGAPYCISAVGTMAVAGMAPGTYVDTNTVVITDILNTTRANGASWLDNVEKIVFIR